MHTKMKLSMTVLALGAVACTSARTTDTAKRDDFKRDLQLASATTMDLASPKVNAELLTSLETAPRGAPEPAATIKKGAGDRAVKAETPTVKAAPEPEVAAVEESTPVVETVAPAPAPEPTPEPVAVAPRPTAQVIPAGGGGAGDYGTGGGVFGGGVGVVIRGGGVDGDRCEIHRGRRPGVYRGPVYVPNRPSFPNTGGITIGAGRISPRGSPLTPRGSPLTQGRSRPTFSTPRFR